MSTRYVNCKDHGEAALDEGEIDTEAIAHEIQLERDAEERLEADEEGY